MKIVQVWPKGYADESGLATLRLEADADVDAAVREAFGYGAKVYHVVDEGLLPEPLSDSEREAYSEMFRGDWS